MRRTALYIRWRATGRMELFVNLGKLYLQYDHDQLGVSRNTLSKKDLCSGYSNEYVDIFKLPLRG
jgi:hypothetical protein